MFMVFMASYAAANCAKNTMVSKMTSHTASNAA
jgi:hypothetical protein